MVILYAGAFSASYLVLPGSMYQSGIILATISLLYSPLINYFSTKIISFECEKHSITNFYDYYNLILGKLLGKIAFILFFLNAFFINICTLISINELISDLMTTFTNIGIFTNKQYCFWAILSTVITTPFVYKSSDGSMMFITSLTFFAIFMSLVVIIFSFAHNGGFGLKGQVKYFDIKGSVFSFDTSFFSYLIQLNIFDLYEYFKGSHQNRFKKILKVSFYSNFLIFVPSFILGKTNFKIKNLI
jgi:amino acid permease